MESVGMAVESLHHLVKSRPAADTNGGQSDVVPAPLASCSKSRRATLAQLVERLIRNQQVAGSTPAGGSRIFNYFHTVARASWVQLGSIRG